MEVKLMRREYDRMKIRVGILNGNERRQLLDYVSKDKKAYDMSDELGITQKAARERIYKIKKKLYECFVDKLYSYSDDSILLLCSIGEA